jgi:hypothetical protein
MFSLTQQVPFYVIKRALNAADTPDVRNKQRILLRV